MATSRKSKSSPTINVAGKPFARYGRVSKIGGRSGDGYISIPVQDDVTIDVANDRGVTYLPDLFIDEDYSGTNLDRPEFERILAMIRAGECGGVVVKTLDRFSRDTIDGLTLLREIESYGGRILCGDGDVSAKTPDDFFMATVRFGMGQAEAGRKGVDMTKSVSRAIGDGVHLQIPFGFKRDEPHTPLAINEDEAPVVRLAFTMRADGASWAAIIRAMDASGIMPRPYRKHGVERQATWSTTTVAKMIRSEVYCGVAWNGDLRKDDAHDAIVSRYVYAKANRARGKAATEKSFYTLSGLVRCAGCGYAMPRSTAGDPRPDGTKNAYYKCQRGTCVARANVPADEIEKLACAVFKREAASIYAEAVPADDDVIADATARVLRAKEKLGKVADLIIEAKLDGASASEIEILDGKRETTRVELHDAEIALDKAKAAARGLDIPAGLDADTFDGMEIAAKRHLLGSMFATIVVRKAAAWREGVEKRVLFIDRNEAPTNSLDLIAHVAGLDW